MRARNRIIVVLAALLLGLFSVQSFAQSDNANPAAFGIGKPERISDLPDSAFRKKLLSLPPKARATALEWLQEFNFPAADVKYLRTTPAGEIYFADTFLPSEADSDTGDTPVISEAIPEAEIFKLHSRPGSTNVLFLDFDGHIITGTAWNSSTGTDPLIALPFDPSTDDSPATVATFSSDELNRIGQIWHRISEDFSPFDIDVTTEEPATFTNTTGRALFTHDTDANGAAMPSQGAGGVAYVPVFGWSNYVSKYSPAFVYYTNLYTNQHGDATLNAEAGSHEFGHNLGLSHDGDLNGSTSSEKAYYGGHGSGFVSWGPIMGGSYRDHVTQWSKGEYSGANNQEDDLVIIAADLGYIVDDHANSSSTATALVVEANGDVLVSSPELDPHNDLTTNKGVVNNPADIDWFYIDVGAGPLTLVATPSWHSFTGLPYRGSNLDIEMTLYDSTLTELEVNDPSTDTFATVSLASAAAGRYYVKIDGVGNANYSDYNSMGMYFIEGTVAPVSLDSTIPSPSPMSFASNPAASGAYSITMTATTATDDSGYIEYQFACLMGGGGCSDSAWQTSTSYTATGLDPNTVYSYVVRARDSSLNTTFDSGSSNATTDLAPPDAPTNLATSNVTQTSIDLSWTDNSNDESGFKVFHSTDNVSYSLLTTTAANTTGISHSGLAVLTTHYYKVRSTNVVGDSAEAGPVNATTLDTLPLAPGALTAAANGATQIDLNWTDNSNNETGFAIQRSPNGTDSWASRGTTGPGINGYSDTSLNPLSTWYYRVQATITGGSSEWSNTASDTTTDTAPGSPTSLTATAVSAGQIDLVWSDNSGNETSFEIERSDSGGNPWVQIDTVGTDVTNYSDIGLSELSTYYYRVNATGSGGDSANSNTANASTFTGCSASKTFVAYEWYQFSLACNPAPNDTKAEIFTGYDADVYQFDASNDVYIALGPADQMQPGIGYFVIFYPGSGADTNFILNGYTNTAADIPLVNDVAVGIQNLVGFYGNGTISWADVLVVDGAQTKTIAEADPMGKGPDSGTHVCDLATPTSKCLMSRKLNIWTGSQYMAYDGETAGMVGDVNALEAIWVKAFKAGLQLRFPDPVAGSPASTRPSDGSAAVASGNKTTGKGQDKKNDPAAWFIRLIAESGDSRDKGNVLGQHPGSDEGLDSHDLEEKSPNGGTWLSILFTNPLFDEVDWGYTSDYRAPAATAAGQWPFVVKSSSEFSEITLRWQGRNDLFGNAWLVNEQTGDVIKVEADGSYTFSPQDGISHFTFVIE